MPVAACTEANATLYVRTHFLLLTIRFFSVMTIGSSTCVLGCIYSLHWNYIYRPSLHNLSTASGGDDFLTDEFQFPPSTWFSDLSVLGYGDNLRPLAEHFKSITTIQPCFDIYHAGQLCPIPSDVLWFPYSDFHIPTFTCQSGLKSRTSTAAMSKKAILAPLTMKWKVRLRGVRVCEWFGFVATTGTLGVCFAGVIEKTGNVIVGHGAPDMVLILDRMLLNLQNLTWNGVQGFSMPSTEPFYLPYDVECRTWQLT